MSYDKLTLLLVNGMAIDYLVSDFGRQSINRHSIDHTCLDMPVVQHKTQ